jgi:hypothetical protein
MPIEVVLKGKEIELPDGYAYVDADGHRRTDIRTRWYLAPHAHTYTTYSFTEGITCDVPLQPAVIAEARDYPASAKPIFIGHYWLTGPEPYLLAPNVACLDFSVAKKGYLCAYRWQGEQQLQAKHFVWTRR